MVVDVAVAFAAVVVVIPVSAKSDPLGLFQP